MTIEILSLPRNSMHSILFFVRSIYIFRMRMVSKSVKETLDESMLTARNNYVSHFRIDQPEHAGAQILRIRFGFKYTIDYAMWTIKIRNVRTKIEVLEEEDDAKYLSTSMNSENALKFLGHLKDALQRTSFSKAEHVIYCDDPSIIRMCTHIFAGKDLLSTRVWLDFRHTDYTPWLELLKSVHTIHVICEVREDSKTVRELILKLADFVFSMEICFMKRSVQKIDEFARNILNGKCVRILFNMLSAFITLNDAEKILQQLHRLGNKTSFEAWTLAEPMNVQIGQCKLDIVDMRFPAGHKQISIKHLLN